MYIFRREKHSLTFKVILTHIQILILRIANTAHLLYSKKIFALYISPEILTVSFISVFSSKKPLFWEVSFQSPDHHHHHPQFSEGDKSFISTLELQLTSAESICQRVCHSRRQSPYRNPVLRLGNPEIPPWNLPEVQNQ